MSTISHEPATANEFQGGYPTAETASKAMDDADMSRAVEAYRFFYPTVSDAAIFKGNVKVGVIPDKVFGTLDSQPKHIGFTYRMLAGVRSSPAGGDVATARSGKQVRWKPGDVEAA